MGLCLTPSINSRSHLYWGATELDPLLQVQTHQCWAERKNNLSWATGDALPHDYIALFTGRGCPEKLCSSTLQKVPVLKSQNSPEISNGLKKVYTAWLWKRHLENFEDIKGDLKALTRILKWHKNGKENFAISFNRNSVEDSFLKE